ncbi:MAG: VTT domain-containing protein [Gemmataceae bacterium]|nr:VTT domain-containing protein [Gemmataceae bacterium]
MTAAPEPATRTWGRWLVLAAVIAGVALFLAYGPDEQTVIRRSGEWRAAARADLAAALAVFVLAGTVVIALSVPVGIWLTALAGFLFGTWLGAAAVNIGATAGAALAFLAARYVFAGPLRRAASRPRLGRAVAAIDRGFRERGAYYVLLLRLTPILPFWVLNLGLALTPVRLRDYWWATQLGTLPATVVVANAGASLAEVTTFQDILSWKVLAALCLLPLVPFVLHHTIGRRLEDRPPPAGGR